jgi:hypothetical protein
MCINKVQASDTDTTAKGRKKKRCKHYAAMAGFAGELVKVNVYQELLRQNVIT